MMEPVEAACLQRGIFLAHHSAYEFSLAQFLVAASQIREYADICKSMPNSLSGRIEMLRSILATAGPLRPIREAMSRYYEACAEAGRERQFIVHGMMQVWPEVSGQIPIRFFNYPFNRGDLQLGFMETTLDKLTEIARRMGATSNDFLLFVEFLLRTEIVSLPDLGPEHPWVDRPIRPL